MRLTTRLQLYWQHLGWTERVFILLPLLILTPRLLDHPSAGHNGEPSQEFAITLSLLALLCVWVWEARRNISLRFSWRGRGAGLLFLTALFTVWSATSLLWTVDVGATLDHTVLWLSYTIVLFVGRNVLRKRSVIGLAAMLVTAVTGVTFFRLSHYWLTTGDRSLPSALYLNFGVEPELILTILPLVLVICLSVRRRKIAGLCLLIAALMWMGSLSTYQRTPILALSALTLCVVAGWKWGWLQPRYALRSVGLMIVLCLVSVVQLSLPSRVQGWTYRPKESGQDFVVKQVKGIGAMEGNTRSRLQFWGAGLQMAWAHPMQGVGAGGFKSSYLTYRRIANTQPFWGANPLYSQVEGSESTYRAHNEFIQVLGELGIVGLALLIGLLCGAGILSCQCAASQRWIALSLSAGLIAFLVCSCLSSFSFRWMPCGFIAFLLMALALPNAKQDITKMRKSSASSFNYYIAASLILLALMGASRTTQVILSEYHELQARDLETTDRTQSFQHYQKALTINPYNFSGSAGLGTFLYRTKRPQEAIAPLERGLRYGVNHIEQQALLSFACVLSGDLARAREVLRNATEAYPDSLFLRALYIEILEKEGATALAYTQRAILHSSNHEEGSTWEQIIHHGLQAATIAANEKKCIHPAMLLPKSGVGVLQERAKLYSPTSP